MLAGDFSTVASAQCRAQGNLTLPAALGFVNNRINPALLSPAALAIARKLPTTTDPCGQVAYSQTTKPRESQPIGRVDWQVNTAHQLFARYQLATTFWDPAFTNSGGNILSAAGAGAGGRDNASHSLAIGETWVISNTMINNVRVAVNRTRVLRTHADMFGPEDVGVKMFSHVPHYMNITTTGAFSINTGTETFSFYKPNTYLLSDDFTMVRGGHQFGIGAAFSLSNWKTESNVRSMGPISFNGCGDGPSARRLPARPHVRIPRIDALPAGHHAALYGAVRAGHLARVAEVSRSTTVRGGSRGSRRTARTRRSTLRHGDRSRSNTRSTVYPQAPAGLYYPGDPGFPGKTGMKTVWTNIAPRLGPRVGPERRRPHVGARRLWHDRRLRDRPVLLRFALGAAVRPGAAADRRAVRRSVGLGRTDESVPGSPPTAYPWASALYPLFITVPYDIKTTRNHSWNVAVQQQFGDNMAVSATYLGNHMFNVWGIVDGNPGVVTTPGATATAAVHALAGRRRSPIAPPRSISVVNSAC